jgi:hypothetical protein|tara:strand:+ start:665 stop:1168 length:504 start_codon:yes stop_codon:yes gene_type:complete
MGKKVYVECELEWTKLREEDRDMGPNDGSDMANNFNAKQGIYVVNCIIDDEAKKKMVSEGIPNKGLQAQLFKTNKEGKDFYKATRPHFNPKFLNQETGEQGVVMGAPDMLKLVDGEYLPWSWDEDGLIGNGSKATVKFDVWDGKITTMEKVCVTEHLVYEANDRGAF